MKPLCYVRNRARQYAGIQIDSTLSKEDYVVSFLDFHLSAVDCPWGKEGEICFCPNHQKCVRAKPLDTFEQQWNYWTNYMPKLVKKVETIIVWAREYSKFTIATNEHGINYHWWVIIIHSSVSSQSSIQCNQISIWTNYGNIGLMAFLSAMLLSYLAVTIWIPFLFWNLNENQIEM